MSQRVIRVGVVGAHAKASWAKVSHIPAIKGLPDLELAAVATRNEQSAQEAAEAFGASRWFADPLAMIRDDSIDLVTIAVKVPAHRKLVLAALGADKAVYCEAPLGRSVVETDEMAAAVGAHYTAIGLQGRLNPAARRAAELVSSGKIGRPLSARIVSTTVGFGPEMPSSHNYFNKAAAGANLLTINAGHALDLMEAVLEPIIEVDARVETLWPTVLLTDTGKFCPRDVADYVSVQGKTRSGAVFTADIQGGVAPEGARFTFDIRGTEGWLSLTSRHPYGSQAGDLLLTSSIPFTRPEAAAVCGGFQGAAINVAEVYAHLARDLRQGTRCAPGFDHALHNARLVEAVGRAARRGERQRITN